LIDLLSGKPGGYSHGSSLTESRRTTTRVLSDSYSRMDMAPGGAVLICAVSGGAINIRKGARPNERVTDGGDLVRENYSISYICPASSTPGNENGDNWLFSNGV